MGIPGHAVILLVEDRPDDVLLVRRALGKAGISNPLSVVTDGEEALAYLDGTGKFSSRSEFPLPDLILLDLKLPKVNGFDVIRYIRQHPTFRNLRIVVLTSSTEISDVNEAYDLGANSYLVKPQEFEDLTCLMRTLAAFWLKYDRMPLAIRPRPIVSRR